MTIQRRTIILGLPMATTLMLTGCGGGEDGAPTSSGERADAMAVGSGNTYGSIRVTAQPSSAWPTSLYYVKLADTLTQAVLNGNEMHICISHVQSGAIRNITLVLRKTSAWVEGAEHTFSVTGAADGSLEGSFSHFSAATRAATKMFFKIIAGTVIAKKEGEFVTLVFSPSSAGEVIASRNATSGSSSNNAPAESVVKITEGTWLMYRTVKLNLVTENETSA